MSKWPSSSEHDSSVVLLGPSTVDLFAVVDSSDSALLAASKSCRSQEAVFGPTASWDIKLANGLALPLKKRDDSVERLVLVLACCDDGGEVAGGGGGEDELLAPLLPLLLAVNLDFSFGGDDLCCRHEFVVSLLSSSIAAGWRWWWCKDVGGVSSALSTSRIGDAVRDRRRLLLPWWWPLLPEDFFGRPIFSCLGLGNFFFFGRPGPRALP